MSEYIPVLYTQEFLKSVLDDNCSNSKVKLYIIRGLPGVGKSTLGNYLKQLGKVDVIHEADDYFTDVNRNYNFDSTKLSEAHNSCKKKVYEDLMQQKNVALCNTNSKRWEFNYYIQFCNQNNIYIKVITLIPPPNITDDILAKRNVHEVPRSVISNMRERFEVDWKNADPTPPVWYINKNK